MIDISITANVTEISKKLRALAYKELPFATARAVTELAREVQAAERAAIESVFDKPRPFTVNSVSMFGASKDNLTAGVFVRPVAAAYLSPFEDNGLHFLSVGQTKLHVPVQAPTDSGGNLRRNFERNRRGAPGIFFGVVQTKKGPINGMWLRTIRYEVRNRSGKVRLARSLNRGSPHAGANGKPRIVKGLKLLVEYVGNKPVKQHLGFFDRAQRLVNRRFNSVFGRELAVAIARSKLR